MKTILFLVLALLFLSGITNGQTGTRAIYDENGQYIKETYMNDLHEQGNVLTTELYQLGRNYYPRFKLEGYSIFHSGLGIWGFGEYSQPVVYQKWRDKGYSINNDFNLSVNVAGSYDFYDSHVNKIKVFAGFGYGTGKRYFGPLAGIYIDNKKWHLKAYGLYAIRTAYKAHYSPAEIAENNLHGGSVFIDGFDPNSWYKATLGYSFRKNLQAGLISERFYSTGLFGEYDLGIKARPDKTLQNLKLRVISGRNFEAKENCFSLGIVMGLQ
jgi:hypothetical protein